MRKSKETDKGYYEWEMYTQEQPCHICKTHGKCLYAIEDDCIIICCRNGSMNETNHQSCRYFYLSEIVLVHKHCKSKSCCKQKHSYANKTSKSPSQRR